jgi:hypothetical protein
MEFYTYFKSYKNYFWQWEEHCSVIGIPESNTIAYREFVIEILEHLAPQGIPSFGSLLLALIATNPHGKVALDTVYTIVTRLNPGVTDSTVDKGITFLNLLSEVPPEFKTGKKRLALLQTIFAGRHNLISGKKSKPVITRFAEGNYDFSEMSLTWDYTTAVTYRDFRIFSQLETQFTSVDQLLAEIAQLPELPEEAELEKLPQPETPSQHLVQEMIENYKTFHAGALVQQIWMGLQIPFHLSQPSQQPMGGVADLTNKGDLSKLLISEFANEESIFLSRFVNNEALYINREIPPQNNDLERVVLVDVSIKSWGNTKTMAHAIAIAIAKHPKTDIPCSIYAVGNSFYPINFSQLSEVIEGLQLLDATMDATQGVEAFFKTHHPAKKRELIYISSKETRQLPATQKWLNEYHQQVHYIIQTEPNGEIDLYKKQQKSLKHVQHIQLPLDELWKKPAKIKEDKIELSGSNGIYPILFPKQAVYKTLFPGKPQQVYLVNRERSLLTRNFVKDEPPGKGWEMMYEGLPGGMDEFEMGELDTGEKILLMFRRHDVTLHFLNLSTREIKTHWFGEWKSSAYSHFLFLNGAFYYLYLGFPSTYWVFGYGPEIEVTSYRDIPKTITDAYLARNSQLSDAQSQRESIVSILKNIQTVFINRAGNLVFNKHELNLHEDEIFKLKQTNDLEPLHLATHSNPNEFTFDNGNVVTINRSGMIMLKNNKAPASYMLAQKKLQQMQLAGATPQQALYQLQQQTGNIKNIPAADPSWVPNEVDFTIYLPAALDVPLGLATDTHFTGYKYYLPSPNTQLICIQPREFWDLYIQSFIHNIRENGTKN